MAIAAAYWLSGRHPKHLGNMLPGPPYSLIWRPAAGDR